MENHKKDYLVAVVAGLATALLLLPTLKNIKIGTVAAKLILPIAIPLLWVIGLLFGKWISKFISFGYQFAKFVVVGFLNTAIDFGVLNFLSLTTGVTAGFLVGGVNVPGFMLAALNSYFWNKFWVFKSKEKGYGDFFSFAFVVIIGVFINGGIVVLLTTYVDPLFGFSPERWLNVAKAGATVVSLVWNFVGFKFLVFKR